MAVIRVAREEILAFFRGRFGLPLAAGGLILLAVLAAVAGSDSRYEFAFVLPAFAFTPLALLPITAARFAHMRESRAIETVFTTPVTATQYFFGLLGAHLALAVACTLMVLPFTLVRVAHLGSSGFLWNRVLVSAGVGVHAVFVGALVGVLFAKRGTLAALATGGALAAGSAAALAGIDSVILMESSGLRRAALHLAHASAPVVLTDFLPIGGRFMSAEPARATLAYAGTLAVTVLLGWWVFTREQSPEGWEASASRVLGFVTAAVLLVASPVATASIAYDAAGDGAPVQESYSADGIRVIVVERGAPPLPSSRPWEPFVVTARGETPVDLVVFVHPLPDVSEPLRDVRVRVTGSGVGVVPAVTRVNATEHLPTAPPPGRTGGEFPYLRVPVILDPAEPVALRGNPHKLTVNLTYSADGRSAPVHASAEVRVESEVPGAPAHLFMSGLPAPALALLAFGTRKWRARWRA